MHSRYSNYNYGWVESHILSAFFRKLISSNNYATTANVGYMYGSNVALHMINF